MRKIKSVRLAKDFNNGFSSVKAGAKLRIDKDAHYCHLFDENDKLVYCYPESDIRENAAGLFQIEYENIEGEALTKLIQFAEDMQEKYPESNVMNELRKLTNRLLYNTK